MINFKDELLKISIDVNYIDIYLQFIEENSLKEKIKTKTQSHHILPKYYFPDFSNLNTNVWNMSILTHGNHLYAHFLLSKMIGSRMSRAFYTMCNINKNKKFYEDKINIYMIEYENAKHEHLKYFSENNPSQTDKHINKMRQNNPMFNPETRKKVSQTLLDKNYKVIHTEETIEKIRKSKIGDKNPMYGNSLASFHLNNTLFKCIHCGMESTKGNIVRWHNKNCKFNQQK